MLWNVRPHSRLARTRTVPAAHSAHLDQSCPTVQVSRFSCAIRSPFCWFYFHKDSASPPYLAVASPSTALCDRPMRASERSKFIQPWPITTKRKSEHSGTQLTYAASYLEGTGLELRPGHHLHKFSWFSRQMTDKYACGTTAVGQCRGRLGYVIRHAQG